MGIKRVGLGGWARPLRSFVVIAALIGGIPSCGGAAGDGDLEVLVKDVSMAAVGDATVTTEPATKSLTTDASGRVHYSSLAVGQYTVKAVRADVGIAVAQISVGAGASRELTLILRKAETGREVDGGGLAGADGGQDGGQSSDADNGDHGPAGSPSILLQDLSKDTNGVNLRWSITATFATYRIYRGQDPGGAFSIIDILNDASARTYRDETVALGTTYRYRVGAISGDGTEVLSNTQSMTAGVFIAVNAQVERMKADPQRPYLYAIDRVNNSLYFINLTSNTLEKTIFIGSAPTALDINMAGTELYVANSGSTEIAVVDLATRVKSRSLLVDATGSYPNGNPYRLVCTAGNTLVFSGQDSFSALKLVNATTGATITTTNSSNGGAMVASPDGTHVYATGYSLVRFDIVGAMMKQVDTSGDFGSNAYPISRSGDGVYLFYGPKKVLATNLKSVLGTFPETIQLANSDGSVAVGMIRVYDGATFTAKATLPSSTPVMALSADDKTLFLYQSLSSRIFAWKMP